MKKQSAIPILNGYLDYTVFRLSVLHLCLFWLNLILPLFMKTFKKALVLSGGSVKGAYQAGALREALRHFSPDAIYGISVGSLNGAFLASKANNDYIKHGREPDWPVIGQALYDFWVARIRKPGDIVRKRNFFNLGASFITRSWNGLYSNEPLWEKIDETIADAAFHHSNAVYLKVGSLNLVTGEKVYADHTTQGGIKQHVLSSAAIPFIMPTSHIRTGDTDNPYLDGGLRDSSPLGEAIRHGAEEVLCIYCHPEKLKVEEDFEHGKFKEYANRVMDVISNENINNDHKIGTLINRLIAAGVDPDDPASPIAGKRPVTGIESPIRPERQLEIDIENFNENDIARLMHLGENDAIMHFSPQSAPMSAASGGRG